jgi:glycosyltransferase involved in cell wall biosynthesis
MINCPAHLPVAEKDMRPARKKFSICIPAYNRAHHLTALLDSIIQQSFRDFEIVVCEDVSREREQIAAIVHAYQSRYPGVLRYFENGVNLGYDGNIRNLVKKASGEFCFFMGNDDIMCEGALENVAEVISRHSNVGLVLKSYAWFDEVPEKINQEVRYFNEETELEAGPVGIRFAFRRSGVISGFIVHRDAAQGAATSKFDGTLYYQMHLTSSVLIHKTVVCTPKVLVLCRNGEPPDFGNSATEKGKYTPGRYTPEARLHMVAGALSIVRDLKEARGIDVVEDVVHDYANYFYPYIKDQLTLPLRLYWKLYRDFGRLGFRKYPLFHVYFILGYLLGEKRFELLAAVIKRRLGRSPRF